MPQDRVPISKPTKQTGARKREEANTRQTGKQITLKVRNHKERTGWAMRWVNNAEVCAGTPACLTPPLSGLAAVSRTNRGGVGHW